MLLRVWRSVTLVCAASQHSEVMNPKGSVVFTLAQGTDHLNQEAVIVHRLSNSRYGVNRITDGDKGGAKMVTFCVDT